LLITSLLFLKLKKFIGREFDTESIVAFLKEILTKYEPKSLKMIRHSLKSYSKFEKIEIE
jgi:hypothetical protein